MPKPWVHWHTPAVVRSAGVCATNEQQNVQAATHHVNASDLRKYAVLLVLCASGVSLLSTVLQASPALRSSNCLNTGITRSRLACLLA
jgi:uncharacterized membrane protein YqhA